jgi:uncharacterized membrane protein YedE/YeeE
MRKATQLEDTNYFNPYFGGIILGLILLATFFITGRGLGASGAVKNSVVATVHTITPEHAENSTYYASRIPEEKSPLNAWLPFEVLGILAGALVSGALGGRLRFRIEKSPKITNKTRLIAALLGGLLFGIGAQFARGCTSGAALSGTAVLSAGGFLTMICIFGSAFVFARFFRKLWV